MDHLQRLVAPVSVSIFSENMTKLMGTCLPVEVGHEMMVNIDTLSSVVRHGGEADIEIVVILITRGLRESSPHNRGSK